MSVRVVSMQWRQIKIITASLFINNQKLEREKLLFVILIGSECYIVLYDLKSRHLGSEPFF